MKIKVSNITYDLYDKETNPNNDLSPEDFDLPSELMIEENDLSLEDEDIVDVINSYTGFPVDKFKYEVLNK